MNRRPKTGQHENAGRRIRHGVTSSYVDRVFAKVLRPVQSGSEKTNDARSGEGVELTVEKNRQTTVTGLNVALRRKPKYRRHGSRLRRAGSVARQCSRDGDEREDIRGRLVAADGRDGRSWGSGDRERGHLVEYDQQVVDTDHVTVLVVAHHQECGERN